MNDDHLSNEEKIINLNKEKVYERTKYEVQLAGKGLKNFHNIYSRLGELNRCKGINNPTFIKPSYESESNKHLLTIVVQAFEQYSNLKKAWPKDAFGDGVIVSDRPPNLPIIITGIDSSIKIDPKDKRIMELQNRYGIMDVERIFKQDGTPTYVIRANVLTERWSLP